MTWVVFTEQRICLFVNHKQKLTTWKLPYNHYSYEWTKLTTGFYSILNIYNL